MQLVIGFVQFNPMGFSALLGVAVAVWLATSLGFPFLLAAVLLPVRSGEIARRT